MTVDESTDLKAERDGQTFYFCSGHCRQKFLASKRSPDTQHEHGHHPCGHRNDEVARQRNQCNSAPRQTQSSSLPAMAADRIGEQPEPVKYDQHGAALVPEHGERQRQGDEQGRGNE